MALQDKKIAILVENLYQELEVWYPFLRFREEGAACVVVGSGTAKEYTSKLGYPVKAEAKASDVSGADFDAVVIPGGYAPDIMRRHPAMVNLVRDAYKAGRIVAAICHGGWMLVSAGILKKKRATCFFAIKDDLIAAGADYLDEETVVDGNLITARKPEDLPAFCRAIMKALK